MEDPVTAPGTADRHDRPVGQEAVRRAVEDPCRLRELRLQRRERFQPRAVDEAIEVPPPAPIADEVEDPVRRPFGLDDRFVRATRGEVGGIQVAVAPDRGDSQAGRIPGHVGVVPFEPGEPRPVRGQAGRGKEVRPFDQDPRRSLAVERHLDDRRDRLAVARVVLAHGQEATTAGVETQVGVSVVAHRGDGHGVGCARIQAIQPAVGTVREGDRAAGDRVRTAAVLVDATSDIERRGGHVIGRPVDPAPHEDAPACLGGPALDPVGLVAIDPGLAEPDRVAEQVLDPDRRRPAAVGQPRPLIRIVVGTCRVGG